jgi:hypothetical protein
LNHGELLSLIRSFSAAGSDAAIERFGGDGANNKSNYYVNHRFTRIQGGNGGSRAGESLSERRGAKERGRCDPYRFT